MKMVKVSVIVPIYNKEKVLKRNVHTILNQTLKDIEIILINDGSTDRSGQICEDIQRNDKRVKVMHQPNKGVSVARNTGISVATGDYIGFVDPDDWIELDMYENMYTKIKETHANICLCNYSVDEIDKRRDILLETPLNVLNKTQIRDNLILNMIAPKTVNSSEKVIIGTVWRLLIERQIIEKNNLSFIENLPIMEDLIFTINSLSKVYKVCIDENVNYHYVQDNSSAINKYRENLVELNEIVNNKLVCCLRENNLYEISTHRINNRYIFTALNEIRNATNGNKSIRDKIISINKICENMNLQNSLKLINLNGFTLRKKVVLYSIKYNKPTILYLYYVLEKKLHSLT